MERFQVEEVFKYVMQNARDIPAPIIEHIEYAFRKHLSSKEYTIFIIGRRTRSIKNTLEEYTDNVFNH